MATSGPRGPDTQSIEFVTRRTGRGVSLVWIIPVVALAIAAWLGWSTWSNQGPAITITFAEASGLEPAKTKIRFKAIEVGEVTEVSIGEDFRSVVVTARMHKEMAPLLTEGARFWVVRPRIGEGQISGLETIVSGAYVELDRGPPDAAETRQFVGLEVPPPLRSDAPGRSFVLKTPTLAGVGRGTPVYYRDVEVGRVLSHSFAQNQTEIDVEVFVNAPFDELVRADTAFWNVSGIRASIGAGGLALSVSPVPKIIRGGIAFDTDVVAMTGPRAEPQTSFPLYESEAAAHDAVFVRHEEVMVFAEGSVRGLQAGSAVEVRGLRVGQVTDVRLVWDPDQRRFAIPVRFRLDLDRIAASHGKQIGQATREQNIAVLRGLVELKLRAQLRSGNLLTGEQVLALDFVPEAPPVEWQVVDGVPVIPSLPPSLDSLEKSLTSFMDKVASLPLDQSVIKLNAALDSVNNLAGGDATKRAVTALSQTLADVQLLAKALGEDAAPMMATLRSAATRLDQTLADLNGLVAQGSSTRVQTDRTLHELADAARSIRLFADYLQRNPEALLRGKGGFGQ